MQLYQLKPASKNKKRKRVGRGGKRGTYSGRGSKGQKSRAGARIRPGFRGGDTPVWKLFPKRRGATKRVEVKHARFQIRREKPKVFNIGDLNNRFNEGEMVSPQTLLERGLVKKTKSVIKILGDGELKKKLTFSNLAFSKKAREKIIKAGGVVEK